MPHNNVPYSHDPMVADVIKSLFLAMAVTYLNAERVPTMYTMVMTAVSIIIYWTFVYKIFPGDWARTNDLSHPSN